MSNITSGWYKLHRPTSIDDYIFQTNADELKFLEYVAVQNFPDLMFMGHRGTGKTTLAYILKRALNIPDIDTLILNASDANSVDDIRNTVKPFINSLSLDKFKLVILDEADALTTQAQEALKSMMEDPDQNARFILICNKPHKIIPEIHSRCTGYKFSSLEKSAMKKMGLEILQARGMDFTTVDQKELLETVDAHIKFAYPDLRKFITSLEKGYTNGTLLPPSYGTQDLELMVRIIVELEDDNWVGVRDIIYEDLPTDDIGTVYRFLDSNLHEVGKFDNDEMAAKAYTTLAHFAAQHETVAIPELNLTACMIKLCQIRS
jgi:DNA polymerase III delta prime subunit